MMCDGCGAKIMRAAGTVGELTVDAVPVVGGMVELVDGVAVVHLPGQSELFAGLPVGARYRVHECPATLDGIR